MTLKEAAQQALDIQDACNLSKMCERSAQLAGELFEQLAYEKTGFHSHDALKKNETVAVGAAS